MCNRQDEDENEEDKIEGDKKRDVYRSNWNCLKGEHNDSNLLIWLGWSISKIMTFEIEVNLELKAETPWWSS